jgi:2-dehydro-3-deoxy-D-arabinonate dehydratase
MRYYRLPDSLGYRLVAEDDGDAHDLTAARDDLTSFRDLARVASLSGTPIDEITARLLDDAAEIDSGPIETEAARPVVPDEVWAAGMTYEISKEAREGEQAMPEVYLEAYDAERPVLFHKATANRTVGPGDEAGIREDSEWDVPEPELGIVLYDEEIVGYTLGNDLSSRSIEGGNPNHQQQAKVFEKCCSIGPAIASAASIDDPHDLEMTMSIEREGEQVFEGSTSTSKMVRSCDELVSYYTRHNKLPEVAVLLTGTSLVPPDEFTLQAGDIVSMSIEGVGTLQNKTVTV